MSEPRDSSFLLMGFMWCVSFGFDIGLLAWAQTQGNWGVVGGSAGLALLAFGLGVANFHRFVNP